jgi:hypothetical protein
MTDGQGRTVDFRNAVIIMTSNLGTEFASKGGALGFVSNGDPQLVADHKKIDDALRKNFRPEFLNRIDEIIIFAPLSREQVEQIWTCKCANPAPAGAGSARRADPGGAGLAGSARASTRPWRPAAASRCRRRRARSDPHPARRVPDRRHRAGRRQRPGVQFVREAAPDQVASQS